MASRILFEGTRAIGVEYRQDGRLRRARADGEVIVSGGAFNSPQLLQLSGVGPAALLQSFGIPLVRDMPGVGADLQDHFQARFNYRCNEPITTNDAMATLRGRVGAGLQYMLFRRGPLSIGAGYAGGFFKTDPSLPSPDVQIHFILFSADSAGQQLHKFSGFLASVCQLRPQSRGHVRIASADPEAAPAIQPNYMSAAADRDVMIAGMKLTRRIMSQPAIARYIVEELNPGAAMHQRCRSARFRACQGDNNLPSDRHLPHGCRYDRRRRRAAAGPRSGAPARHRWLGHAVRGVGQHQCRHHHDRREGCGDDLAGCRRGLGR